MNSEHYYSVAKSAALRGDRSVFELAVRALRAMGANRQADRAEGAWEEYQGSTSTVSRS